MSEYVKVLDNLEQLKLEKIRTMLPEYLEKIKQNPPHLAVALGIKATEHRYSVYFITCHALIMKLNKAQKENRLDQLLRHMSQYRILIIDEIGYLPVDKQGSNLFCDKNNRKFL